jgi:excinuclease ABC subunit C
MVQANSLKEKIRGLPESMGVYIFKDAHGEIIYIGKAKSLRRRVQSYFSRQLDSKTQAMVEKISDIEYRLVSSESQAEILEASLVKDYQPRYNISLKDDKSFPWIRITNEEFPIVSISRKKKPPRDDNSLWFGPYTNVKLLRKAIKVIRRILGFRSCKKIPEKPCLYYRLKLCPAPCAEAITPAQYKEIIHQIKMLLESRNDELVNRLSERMQEAVKDKRFEEAAKIRDQIIALNAVNQSPAASSAIGELENLRRMLKLDKLPLRIEAFDISNISGKEATGSMVSFYKGMPDKNNYRRFRIKTVSVVDDYGMLREVIGRRYSRSIRENLSLPDLVLIDGGRGHLSAAYTEIKRLGLDLALVSIAKEKENLYIIDRINPIRLSENTPALNLIRRIRDEAHRFALKYHHLLHRKKVLGSI